MAASWSLVACASAASATPAAPPGPTVDAIRARGAVACGVMPGTEGFAVLRDDGAWTGLDVSYCRALAAAVLGDAARIRLVPVTDPTRMTLLASGALDVLMGETVPSFTRSAWLGFDCVAVTVWRNGRPFGLLTRSDDPRWRKIVFWLDDALKLAEALRISRASLAHPTGAHAMSAPSMSEDPQIPRLLGTEGHYGATLGLDDDWSRRALAAVGNYGEMFVDAFGNAPRGWNALARDGGTVTPLPFE